MATRNDITGDALVNIPKRGPSEGKKREFVLDMPVFEVFFCGRCHIKVSTSDGHCPCCTKELKND